MKRSRDYSGEEKEECKKKIFTYMNHVKEIFGAENRDKYDEFLRLSLRLKNTPSELEEIKQRFKELFHGYKDLIIGFNTILPEKFQIKIDEEPRKKKMKRESYKDQAVDFLNDLKVLSNNNGVNPNLYMGFLSVMRYHHEKGMPIEDVNNRVRFLLQNYPDLFHKFINFQSESEQEIIEPVLVRNRKRPPACKESKLGFLDRLLKVKGYNPSYVTNPEESPRATNESEIVGEVLDQSWIISKTVAKNSEERGELETKEDGFHKFDIRVKVLQSTMICLNNLIEKTRKDPSLQVGIEDFKGEHLRCIKSMYGNSQNIFMDFLKDKTTAAKALPCILESLRKMLEKASDHSDLIGRKLNVYKVDYSDYLIWDEKQQKNVVVDY